MEFNNREKTLIFLQNEAINYGINHPRISVRMERNKYENFFLFLHENTKRKKSRTVSKRDSVHIRKSALIPALIYYYYLSISIAAFHR